MLDLRINYLQYKEVEFTYESSGYDVSQASGLATQLKKSSVKPGNWTNVSSNSTKII